MWMRDPLAIEVSARATTPVGFQLWDDVAGAALDITGYTLSCAVSRIDGSGVVATHDVDITSFLNGEFDIVFDGRQYNYTGMSEVNFSFEVKADDGSGDPVVVMRGLIVLVPGIA
jgi:hypothetical protein